MGEEEDGLVGFVLAECESDGKDAEKGLYKTGEENGSEGEGEETNGRGLALSTLWMASSVRKKKSRWSWLSTAWSERGTSFERVLEGAGRGERERTDFCRLLRGGGIGRGLCLRRENGWSGRSNAGSVADRPGRRN